MHARARPHLIEQRYAAAGARSWSSTFDLDTILRTSVGPRWQSFTPEQQAQLKDEFTKFTVASYLANFNSYQW